MCDKQIEMTDLNILNETRPLCPLMVSRMGKHVRMLQDLKGHDLTSSQSFSEFRQTTERSHSRLKL